MENSNFRKIPVEIRTAIYNLVFQDGIAQNGEIKIHVEDNAGPCPGNTIPRRHQTYNIGARYGIEHSHHVTLRNTRQHSQAPRNQLALTAVCKEMRAEALDALFGKSTLSFSLTAADTFVDELMDSPDVHFSKAALAIISSFLAGTSGVTLVRHLIFPVTVLYLITLSAACWISEVHDNAHDIHRFLPGLRSPIKAVLDLPVEKYAREAMCWDHGPGFGYGREDRPSTRLTRLSLNIDVTADPGPDIERISSEMWDEWRASLALRPEDTIEGGFCRTLFCCGVQHAELPCCDDDRFAGVVTQVNVFLWWATSYLNLGVDEAPGLMGEEVRNQQIKVEY